jgi:selenide,water dikinase
MGGRPLTVMIIVGFPVNTLDMSILADILRGASENGMSVTGVVHPDKVWTNSGVKTSDALILTKPIGVGIQTTAIKKDALTDDQLERVMQVMAN